MGKKARKTRWRTLTIADEHSDSEESNTTTAPRLPNGYQQKSYYNKFSYSSQSTPRRRYQHDSTKSTRSSSTASENKITFNEDEYTRITTPRQDVLFKKGYLNKPKTYQTQTSTGTSTTSTGNSTGNGTPDHQSTDLDYESQFVFPNGFVDQNGIYYVNSYESYPLMLYNPQTYYPEFSNCKSKRYSTGSLTESMSPNNEEATSQDLSGGEASNNVSDYSGHHQVYNMVYPGYYVNGVCPSNGLADGQCPTDQTRRIKKRRRRKTSKSQTAQDSSEYTEDESDSCDEEKPKNHPAPSKLESDNTETVTKEEATNGVHIEAVTLEAEKIETIVQALDEKADDTKNETVSEEIDAPLVVLEGNQEPLDEESKLDVHQATSEITATTPMDEEHPQIPSVDSVKPPKSDLKPDAEEFVPRAYRNPDIPLSPNVQFIKVPPNFVPIPMVPLGDFNGQNFSPAFIPPGIPINFLPPDPKLFPNYVGFVPNTSFTPKSETGADKLQTTNAEITKEQIEAKSCDNFTTAKDEDIHQNEEPIGKSLIQNVNNKTIDIATIVSKLEEAAKEQEDEDAKNVSKDVDETQTSPRRKYYENKRVRVNQKYKNNSSYKRYHYINPQNSPQKSSHYLNGDVPSHNADTAIQTHINNISSSTETSYELKPETKVDTSKETEVPNGVLLVEAKENAHQRNSPEKTKKNWKYQPYQGSPKWQPNGAVKDFKLRNNKSYADNDVKDLKEKSNGKNYSEMLRNRTQNQTEQKQRRNVESPKKEATKSDSTVTPAIPSPKQPSQWISVSSRKKRKNKNIEGSDASFTDHLEEEMEEQPQNDVFETYDVNQLVDVIPAKSEEDEVITVEATIEIKDIMNNIPPNNVSLVENNSLNISMRSVSEIEEELIVKEAIESENVVQEVETVSTEKTVTEEQPELSKLKIVSTQEETSSKSKGKKKSKKGTQKPLSKRIMITDVDLSMTCDEIKTPITKPVAKLEDLNEKTEEKNNVVLVKAEDEITEESSKNAEEDEKKKSKKKKKKAAKTTILNSSLSSSNNTINVGEDSYDFLLDSALSDESVEKTNIEISQELDKIIQKGMYSSLEEKMRMLNIDESDGFFKSIFSKISSRESSVEKTGFTNTPDLSNILKSTSTLFKPSSVSQETNSQNKDINTILPDLDSPVEDGFFLENPELNEILHDQTVTVDTEKKQTIIADPNGNSKAINEPIKLDIDVELKTLYPITQAVKEWMCKTRETTPDVEILKSPRAIYEEFCDSASETETLTESKTLNSSELEELNADLSDEENTIFPIVKTQNLTNESMEQSHLPECRENQSEVCENTKDHADNGENKCFIGKDCLNTHIEEGEDAVEIYDSKYGKNENLLNPEEVREKPHNFNYPKHANMPYRAICCNIM